MTTRERTKEAEKRTLIGRSEDTAEKPAKIAHSPGRPARVAHTSPKSNATPHPLPSCPLGQTPISYVHHLRPEEQLATLQGSLPASSVAIARNATSPISFHSTPSQDCGSPPDCVSISRTTWRELTSALSKLHEILPGLLPEGTRNLCECTACHHLPLSLPTSPSLPPSHAKDIDLAASEVGSLSSTLGSETNPIDLCNMDVQKISLDSPIPDPPTDPAPAGSASTPFDQSLKTTDGAIPLAEEVAHNAAIPVTSNVCEDLVMADETQSAYREEEYKRKCAEVLAIKMRAWDAQAREARRRIEMKEKRKKVLAEKALAWKEKAELARLKKQSPAVQEDGRIPQQAEPPAGVVITLEARLRPQTASKVEQSPEVLPLPPSSFSPTTVYAKDATATFVRASTEDLFYGNKIELLYPTSISSMTPVSPATRPYSSQDVGPKTKTMSRDIVHAMSPRIIEDTPRDFKSEDIKYTAKKRRTTDMPPPPSRPLAASSQDRDVYLKTSLSMRDRYIEDRRKAEAIIPRRSHQMERFDHPDPPMSYSQRSYGTILGERDDKSVRETVDTPRIHMKSPPDYIHDARISKPSQPTHESKPQAVIPSSRPASIHPPPVSSASSSLKNSGDKFYQPESTSSRKRSSPDSLLYSRPACRPRRTSDARTSMPSRPVGTSWLYSHPGATESPSSATYASTHTKSRDTTLPSRPDFR